MSQYSAYYDPNAYPLDYESLLVQQQWADSEEAVRRPRFIALPYIFPTLLFLISSLADGIAIINDFGFIVLTILLMLSLLSELIAFPKRYGVGGIVVFGGCLVWFCHDYWTYWLGRDFLRDPSAIELEVVSRAAFLHSLFIIFMVVGLQSRRTKRLSEWMAMREPASTDAYFVIFFLMFAFGISPYFWYTSVNPYEAIYGAIFGYVSIWWSGRTGNVSANWGQYVAQILQVGQVAGVLGGIYAVGIGRSFPLRIFALLAWLLQCALSFGSGRRGELLFVAGPVIAFVFLQHQAQAAKVFRKISVKGFAITSVLLVILLGFIQILGKSRGWNEETNISEIEFTASRGNTMFSEGLPGYAMIPEHTNYLGAFFPGSTVILPIPETVLRAVMGIIPRALWPDKPIDPLWEWYNTAYKQYLGVKSNDQTTISKGLVGSWYFRYGIPGVIQGAIVFGWLAACAERTIRMTLGKPLGTLIGLAMANYLFRSYRDFEFNNLYPIIIGAVVLWLLVRFTDTFFGESPKA